MKKNIHLCLDTPKWTFYIKDPKTSVKADSKRTAADTKKVQREFWWGNLMERDHLVDPGIDGRIITNHKVVWGHGLD